MQIRQNIINWLAEKSHLSPGSYYPLWIKIIGYSLFPRRILYCLSPIKYNMLNNTIEISGFDIDTARKKNRKISLQMLEHLCNAPIGTTLTIVDRQYDTIIIKEVHKD